MEIFLKSIYIIVIGCRKRNIRVQSRLKLQTIIRAIDVEQEERIELLNARW